MMKHSSKKQVYSRCRIFDDSRSNNRSIFGLVRNVKISDDVKSMLSFESAVTDILATIIAFILFEAVLLGHFDLQVLEETIGRAVVVGLVLGFGAAIPWMYVSTKLGNAQHAYIRCFVCLVLFGKFIWRIRGTNSTCIWFND
jgi:NhaP-type Na+/H+ or K+/H+ antiporter